MTFKLVIKTETQQQFLHMAKEKDGTSLLFWLKNNTNISLDYKSTQYVLTNFVLHMSRRRKCFVCNSTAENNVEWVAKNENPLEGNIPMFNWIKGQHSCLPCWLDAFIRKIHLEKEGQP